MSFLVILFWGFNMMESHYSFNFQNKHFILCIITFTRSWNYGGNKFCYLKTSNQGRTGTRGVTSGALFAPSACSSQSSNGFVVCTHDISHVCAFTFLQNDKFAISKYIP